MHWQLLLDEAPYVGDLHLVRCRHHEGERRLRLDMERVLGRNDRAILHAGMFLDGIFNLHREQLCAVVADYHPLYPADHIQDAVL